MAIYHCSVQVIGRNAGRSSVAAAAYRAGEDLVNEYDGIEHDFTKKNWVVHTEIILHENAPQEYSDRSTLWNAVEMLEKSKDAQLCREFELSLPIELIRKQQIEVAEQFAREKLVSQGMVVDIAIHNPPVMNDRHQPIDADGNPTKDISKMQFINPHAHIMATMRPIDEKGKWMPKSKTEYLCIRDGEEKGFTADEFKQAKEEGWEKQYKFSEGKKKIWLTAEEGKERGLERVNRSPKTTPYGRKNEIIAYWDSKDRIFEWRQHWEKVVNDKFASLNSETRIDCRSFKDQGREDELPTLFDGYKGSFVLYDLQKDNWNIYDIEQATIRISPNSTYKIYDALFALEENIITSENSFISCPQQNYPFESWNEDQTLFSAMNSSVTWYFQALDAKLGKSNLQSYIEQIGYGNQNINGELSSYWMESSLKISPIEQVELLTSLYFNDFGFTPENIQTTKESIQLFSDVNCTIYGKTGTGCIEEKNVNGWFIGFVESKNHTYFFATNIQAIDNATGSIASEITLSILSDMNIYKL